MIGEVEGLENGGFEADEEAFGVTCRGHAAAEQAEQEPSDERNIDLDFDGVFAASEEPFDLEVLLDPLEEQLDLPALLVKRGDFAGGAAVIVGDEDERSFAVALHDDLAQNRVKQRICGSGAWMLMTDLEPVIAENAPLKRPDVCLHIAPFGVDLEPRDEERPRRVKSVPPAKVVIALIIDIGHSRLNRHGADRRHITDLGRGKIEPAQRFWAGLKPKVELEAPGPGVGLGPVRARVADRDRGGIQQGDQSVALTPHGSLNLGHQRGANVTENRHWSLHPMFNFLGIGKGRAARHTKAHVVERSRPRQQPLAQFAQARHAGHLCKQKHPQLPHTGQSARPRPNAVIAAMQRHNPPHLPAIKGFQKAVESAKRVRHGGSPKALLSAVEGSMSRQQDYGTNPSVCPPCNRTYRKNTGQQCAQAGLFFLAT
jgi:hypothetical protein